MRSLIVVWGMLGLIIVAQTLLTDWHDATERWLNRAVWFFWLLTWVVIVSTK